MKGKILLGVAAAGLAAFLMAGLGDGAGATPPDPGHKVTICHAKPPATAANGYNLITVDVASVGYQHSGHQDRHAMDIIPPYDYPGFTFGGKNFDAEGEAVWLNGCKIPSPTPTTTPIPTPTTTPPPTPTTPTPTGIPTPTPTSTGTTQTPIITPTPSPVTTHAPASASTPTPTGTITGQAPTSLPVTGGAP